MNAQAKQSNILISPQGQTQEQDTTATDEAGRRDRDETDLGLDTALAENERDALLRKQQNVKEAIIRSKTNAGPPNKNMHFDVNSVVSKNS